MDFLQWAVLAVFALLVMAAALCGLTASGHFPAEHRGEALRSPAGSALLWGAMAAGVLTALVALFIAWIALPWTWAVIVGGGMLLVAPLVLQRFPDSFVDGRAGLFAFGGGGLILSLAVLLLG